MLVGNFSAKLGKCPVPGIVHHISANEEVSYVIFCEKIFGKPSASVV